MSLQRRYNAYRKRNLKQWPIAAVALFLAAFFLLFCPSLARFTSDWSGDLGTAIAQWKIRVNDVPLWETSETNQVHVKLIADAPIPECPDKIQAGQTGYFDVEIDPTDTEVSFSYAVTVDTDYLPVGMLIDAYSVTDAQNPIGRTALPANHTVGGDKMLPESGVFQSEHSTTVRFYWSWEDTGALDPFDAYRIVVTVAFEQYIGNRTDAEEAQSL